ncbi:MAG: alpha/beta hydrolase [Myxococcaceae bacterium]|jgi:pimeloyl-ACP methyl ester carboxylesterase|nr:alpha/beta hydrolase [Myxococcaceae bacterium]MCA3013331.1 alpha/beta hydrolase [Myxococcaceae bacterium]
MRSPLVLLLGSLLGCATTVPEAVRRVSPPKRLALASKTPRRLLTVDGITLALHDSAPGSSAPVVLCLHAIGHGGSDYDGVVEALSPDWRVITLDWPGHGASDADAQPASAVRYEALLDGVIAQLSVQKLVLVGNSIGGAAAIAWAAKHPERVRGLVLCNPGGLDPGGLIAGLFIDHLVGRFRAGAAGDASFPAWFERYYADVLVTKAAEAQRARIVAAGWESAPVLEQAWRSFARPEADLRRQAATLAMPVLVAWARQDGLIQWSRNEAAVRQMPTAQVVFFEGGHAAFLEQPEAFLGAVRPFLAGLP